MIGAPAATPNAVPLREDTNTDAPNQDQRYTRALARLRESAGTVEPVPHHNMAWRDLADVPYSLCRPGATFRVTSPGSGRAVVDELPSQSLLATRAVDTSDRRNPPRPARGALTHCAHYYFNRSCDRGATCRFVHAVFIDPGATELRRAPAPVQMGRPHRDTPAVKPETRRLNAPPINAPQPHPVGAVTPAGDTMLPPTTSSRDARPPRAGGAPAHSEAQTRGPFIRRDRFVPPVAAADADGDSD